LISHICWIHPLAAKRSESLQYTTNFLHSTNRPVSRKITGVQKIALCMILRFFWNFSDPVIAQIPCSPLSEMQKWNHRNVLITISNQNNSKVLRIVQCMCLGIHIRPKRKMLIMRSMNVILIIW
jgi:hypothetical protein